jgi:hypothetical protein
MTPDTRLSILLTKEFYPLPLVCFQASIHISIDQVASNRLRFKYSVDDGWSHTFSFQSTLSLRSPFVSPTCPIHIDFASILSLMNQRITVIIFPHELQNKGHMNNIYFKV